MEQLEFFDQLLKSIIENFLKLNIFFMKSIKINCN